MTQELIDRLIVAGWLREITVTTGTAGRPARRWEINLFFSLSRRRKYRKCRKSDQTAIGSESRAISSISGISGN